MAPVDLATTQGANSFRSNIISRFDEIAMGFLPWNNIQQKLHTSVKNYCTWFCFSMRCSFPILPEVSRTSTVRLMSARNTRNVGSWYSSISSGGLALLAKSAWERITWIIQHRFNTDDFHLFQDNSGKVGVGGNLSQYDLFVMTFRSADWSPGTYLPDATKSAIRYLAWYSKTKALWTTIETLLPIGNNSNPSMDK